MFPHSQDFEIRCVFFIFIFYFILAKIYLFATLASGFLYMNLHRSDDGVKK